MMSLEQESRAGFRWRRSFSGLVLLSLCLFLSGCRERQMVVAQEEAVAMHGINIRVHPFYATVLVKEEQASLVAVVSQRGPWTTFMLPEGRYSFEVFADAHVTHTGTFEIPQNKNLEVWLTPQ